MLRTNCSKRSISVKLFFVQGVSSLTRRPRFDLRDYDTFLHRRHLTGRKCEKISTLIHQKNKSRSSHRESNRFASIRQFSSLSEGEYHGISNETLEVIHDAVEAALEQHYVDEFEVNLSQGVLTIAIASHGKWVLNKQAPNRQIWWSSPLSGPRRYEYNLKMEKWVNTRDGTELYRLLRDEMKEVTGAEISFRVGD